MCDEFTEQPRFSRRSFAVTGAAAFAAGCVPGAGSSRGGMSPGLSERMVSIQTDEGTADAFFVTPGKGRHPGVIMWPDIGGLREVYKMMARRLASEGYSVLAVNQYWRSAPSPVLQDAAEFRTPEGRAKVAPMIAKLTPKAVMTDAHTFVRFLDKESSVDKRKGIGTLGYCMGGPISVRTAAAVPSRVRAVASFHGVMMATEAPDSPHHLIGSTRAEYLIAIAKNDDARAPADKEALKTAAAAAKRVAEIEVYGGDHGWCVPDSPTYHQAEADRAWTRLLALYARL